MGEKKVPKFTNASRIWSQLTKLALHGIPNLALRHLNFTCQALKSKWSAAVGSPIHGAGRLITYSRHPVLSSSLPDSHSVLGPTCMPAVSPGPHLALLTTWFNVIAFSPPAN